jgi:hypothetical protein
MEYSSVEYMEFLVDYTSQSLHLMTTTNLMDECFNKREEHICILFNSFLLIHLIDLKAPPLNAVSPSDLDQKVEEIQKEKKRQKKETKKKTILLSNLTFILD